MSGCSLLTVNGGSPYVLVILGDEKSSMSLFNTMPRSVITSDPKYVFTDLQNVEHNDT